MNSLLRILVIGVPLGLMYSVATGVQRIQIVGLVIGGWVFWHVVQDE